MTPMVLLRRLHGMALRVQVLLVLSGVPIVATLYGVALVPIAVEAAVGDASDDARAAARAAVGVVVALLVACVWLASIAASMLLRGSIRAVVERMHVATVAIAQGRLEHRISSTRRDELGQLASSIDVMAERLERLDHARRRMLACVSHELRTPLTIIQGHAFTLSRSDMCPAHRARLQMMQDESARLARLIEDLVDASAMQAGGLRLQVEAVELAGLATTSQQRFRSDARELDLQLAVARPRRGCMIEGDVERLDQVLGNLLANAMRHALPGTVIELDVRHAGGSGMHRLTVSNVGEHVAEDVVERMFEPFEQSDTRAGRLGLGLAICHGIVAAHGGRIGFTQRPCTATPGAWVATFSVELPTLVRRVRSAGAAGWTARSTRRPAVAARRRIGQSELA